MATNILNYKYAFFAKCCFEGNSGKVKMNNLKVFIKLNLFIEKDNSSDFF